MKTVDLPKSQVKSIKVRIEKEYKKLQDKVFSNSDPLSVTLKAHLAIEGLIDDIVRDISNKPDHVLKRTFDQKVEILLFSSMLSESIYPKIKALNSLRNKFAHNINYKLARKDVELISSIKGKTNFIKLAAGITYMIGYLHATREINRYHPFAYLMAQRFPMYKKDRLFQYVEKELKEGLKKFNLEHWEIK